MLKTLINPLKIIRNILSVKKNLETQKKIKVVQVSRHAFPACGGVEAVINQIAQNLLAKENFEQEILTCSNNYESEIINEIKINRCKYLFEFAANPISLSLIWKLSKVNTDIIHYHMPFIFGVIAHFIARPKYKKLVVTYHSDIIDYDKIMLPFWPLYKLFLAKTDSIHILSPNILDSSKFLQKYKDKCTVVPYGINLDSVKADEAKTKEIKNKYKDKKILFSMGRLVSYKGFKYAIDAIKYVKGDIVYIIGGNGPLEKELQQQIDDNNLSDKIKLLGRIPNEYVNSYYQACDIYLFPSIMPSEAFGIVQLEAMVCEKPVINTNLGTGVNYVSVHNLTGLTVEPENSKQLADAINLLISDEDLRIKFGKNAKKRVKKLCPVFSYYF